MISSRNSLQPRSKTIGFPRLSTRARPSALSRRPPPVVGDLEDVNTADALSRYLLAAEVPYATQLNFVVSGATPSPISRTILPSVSRTAEAYCERNEGCVRSIMTQYCQTNYGTTASFTGSSDCAKGKCMQCAYTAFLTEFCIVLTAEKKAPEGGGAAAYEADPNFKSCYYPFAVTSQAFGATQQQAKLRVSVRKADDPFIALQRLTEGTSDFGLTKTQQYTTGLILLGIGIAMTVGLAGLVVFMIVHRSRQVGAVEAEEGATAGAGRNSNANRNTTNHHSNNGIAMHQLPAFSGGAGGGHNPQTFRTSQEDSQVFVTTGDNIFFPPPGAVGGAAGTPFADGPFAEATRESQASSSAPPPPGVAQGIPIRTVR